MDQACAHLEPVLTLALAEGCSIVAVEEGWSEAKRVVSLVPKMPEGVKTLPVEEPVKYYSFSGSPHDPPDEGYFCHSCKIGISFALPRK